ncbi:MAG: YbaB/EbfC family nucleoid-associated protein [Candidatus Komeilibacteria bacterium]|nr:YbaB/EbfC family nucleoid-associated protein [Candidatus Komeilibacteria bacterium]
MSLFSKMNDINELRQQAQTIQTMLAQEIITVENSLVKLIMNGQQEILELSLSDDFGTDKEATTEAIKRAFTEANAKVQKVMATKLGGLM